MVGLKPVLSEGESKTLPPSLLEPQWLHLSIEVIRDRRVIRFPVERGSMVDAAPQAGGLALGTEDKVSCRGSEEQTQSKPEQVSTL